MLTQIYSFNYNLDFSDAKYVHYRFSFRKQYCIKVKPNNLAAGKEKSSCGIPALHITRLHIIILTVIDTKNNSCTEIRDSNIQQQLKSDIETRVSNIESKQI